MKMMTNCNSNIGKEYAKGSLSLASENKHPIEFTFEGFLTHTRIGCDASSSAMFGNCLWRHHLGREMVAQEGEIQDLNI
ncbi:OLC1v1012297C1 [Oldenlandia corymbosa var. corymbosa]|uniref:OLC1v1012297C1 n=1 Tax=Oldenlandia corymbosa var. corymbosa TaxID=529605 RepID=A0AAV1DXT3_OLDCO|nr:OLC1v1012297C1 [Oldenlandia corymbosa var. corymbosa]